MTTRARLMFIVREPIFLLNLGCSANVELDISVLCWSNQQLHVAYLSLRVSVLRSVYVAIVSQSV